MRWRWMRWRRELSQILVEGEEVEQERERMIVEVGLR